MGKKYVVYVIGIGDYGSGFVAPDCNNEPNCSAGMSSQGAFIFSSVEDAVAAQKKQLKSSVVIGLKEAHQFSKTLRTAGTSSNTKKSWAQRREAELQFLDELVAKMGQYLNL